ILPFSPQKVGRSRYSFILSSVSSEELRSPSSAIARLQMASATVLLLLLAGAPLMGPTSVEGTLFDFIHCKDTVPSLLSLVATVAPLVIILIVCDSGKKKTSAVA
ncbi:hypothetical protein PENTCL1PPCAC_1701, partial [Pristionchus entomophagus]